MYEYDATQNGARLSEAPTSQLFSHRKLRKRECVCIYCVRFCIRLGNACTVLKGYYIYMYTVKIGYQFRSKQINCVFNYAVHGELLLRR